MSSDDFVLPNFLSAVLLGVALLKSFLIKSCAKTVSEEIQNYAVKDANGLQHHKKY